MSEIIGVLDASAGGLGESMEEMWEGWRELVTSDETTVLAKPFLDAIMMKDG